MNPRNVIFPERFKRRKADCQDERPKEVKLADQLAQIKAGLDAGMTAQEIRASEAMRCQEIIQHWTTKLATYRNPTDAAAFLCALAGRLNGEYEAS